jgi:hypothetical protein
VLVHNTCALVGAFIFHRGSYRTLRKMTINLLRTAVGATLV